MDDGSGALISLQFDCPNEVLHTVDITEVAQIDPNYVDPEAKTSNLSWKYSGRHDHGALPVLVQDKPMNAVVSALLEAKKESDIYLTALIEKEDRERKEAAALNGEEVQEKAQQSTKKTKKKKEGKGKKKAPEQEVSVEDDIDIEAYVLNTEVQEEQFDGEKESETIFTGLEEGAPEKKARVDGGKEE
jgi:hypothetical protein